MGNGPLVNITYHVITYFPVGKKKDNQKKARHRNNPEYSFHVKRFHLRDNMNSYAKCITKYMQCYAHVDVGQIKSIIYHPTHEFHQPICQ